LSPRLRVTTVVLTLVALAACNDDSGSPEALCRAVAEGEGVATVFQGFDPTDPEAALATVREARVVLGDLVDDAPDEVRDDLEVEIDYVQGLIEALEQVDSGDATETALQVQAVTDAHPGVPEASAALATFAEREC
jgi:hypothetical protein